MYETLHLAFEYRDRHFSVLPLTGKRPAISSWKHLTARSPTREEILSWFKNAEQTIHRNIGIVCGKVSDLVAIDADRMEVAQKLYRTLPKTELISKTSRGVHLLYRLEGQHVPPRVKIAGLDLDIRGEGSYICAPPSIHPSGKQYEWVKPIESVNLDNVPVFNPSWIEDELTKRGDFPTSVSRKRIRNVTSYLSRVESVQGQNGSAGLVRACAICRDAGLSEAQATIEILKWNQLPVVRPPWSEREIARAVTRVYRNEVMQTQSMV